VDGGLFDSGVRFEEYVQEALDSLPPDLRVHMSIVASALMRTTSSWERCFTSQPRIVVARSSRARKSGMPLTRCQNSSEPMTLISGFVWGALRVPLDEARRGEERAQYEPAP
jgi:hypothetical protein